MRRRRRIWAVGSVLGAAACGGAPLPPDTTTTTTTAPAPARRADVPDDCAEVPGKPPPAPLVKHYTGVAAKARCQREVYTIMGGLTHFLGVRCEYCHEGRDYAKPTHKKAIANWMAAELIPALEKRGGGDVWCNDCHVVDGKPTAKILGDPRSASWAAEWMTTHLVEDLRGKGGDPLRCKGCHVGTWGKPDFQSKVILTDHLPGKRAPAPAGPSEPTSTGDAGAGDAGRD